MIWSKIWLCDQFKTWWFSKVSFQVDQSRSEHKPSQAAGVVEIEDEEEIFPSVGQHGQIYIFVKGGGI